MKKRMVCFLALLATLGTASLAHAQVTEIPGECASPRESRGYESGFYDSAEYLLETITHHRYCDQLEYFRAVIKARVSKHFPQPGTNDYVKCRYTGLADRVYYELDAFVFQCEDECFSDGEESGNEVCFTPGYEPFFKKEVLEAGPLWNHNHAMKTCPALCEKENPPYSHWTGQWWTTEWGKMSVCECISSLEED